MPKNESLKDALKKAGVSKDTFKQGRLVESKKKSSATPESWKEGAGSSQKLRKAQNQVSESLKDGSKSSHKLRNAPSQAYADAAVVGKKIKKTGKKRKQRKNSIIRTPAHMSGELLESVYGGGKRAKAKSKVQVDKPDIKSSCCLPEPLVRSSIFEDKHQSQSNLLQVSDARLWQSPARNISSENIIVVGLDFGTSSTKVVMQDVAKRAYAVPFTATGENPYLLPAKVYESKGVFSLEPAQKVYRDLKLILIQDSVNLVTLVPAVAYMALILRHCQGWLWDNHGDTYAHDDMHWGLNLGLPAASYENTQLVERFITMAIAARALAASNLMEMQTEDVFDSIKSAHNEINEVKQNKDDLAGAIKERHPVSVFPEIAAQVFGFVRSTSWDSRDRPMMMMVDVGAGTVDASIFTVMQPKRGRRSFNFYGNNVRGNGVMNLHRARLRWLRQLINDSGQMSDDVDQYFCDIEMPTDRLLPVPEAVVNYIPGMEVELNGNRDIDGQFFNRYSTQLHDDTIVKVKTTKDSGTNQWQSLPFFLCGGGKNMEFYKQFAGRINGPGSTSVSLDILEIPKPDGLEAKGLKASEFHRLSVAYGLSFDDIGDFVKPGKIPDISRTEEKATWRDSFIDKDQM